MDRRSEQHERTDQSRAGATALLSDIYGAHSHPGESSERTTGKGEKPGENVAPRLLLDENGELMTANGLQKDNPSWYQKLTPEQKTNVHKNVKNDIEGLDLENAKYYTIKEVLRKSGVDLQQSIGNPSQFGERETVLAGGYPRDQKSLSHIMEAYDKNHNLTIYDVMDQAVPKQLLDDLKKSERQVEFKLGHPLMTMGKVENHDVIIPHPGPKWIEGGLADELGHVLGPGSKAYILTDTMENQKDTLVKGLKQQDRLQIRVSNHGVVAENGIKLNDITIQPTQRGPYYVVEVSKDE
jgi:hypothetical protein